MPLVLKAFQPAALHIALLMLPIISLPYVGDVLLATLLALSIRSSSVVPTGVTLIAKTGELLSWKITVAADKDIAVPTRSVRYLSRKEETWAQAESTCTSIHEEREP